MNKITLIVAVLAYSIFAADTLHFKDGKEIKDATVVEIGVSDVKYKIGTKEVLYIAKKSDIATIFYSDGTEEVFAESKDTYENFSTGRRVGTWALNAFTINGVGSWVLMGDVAGGFSHFGLGVASVVTFYLYVISIFGLDWSEDNNANNSSLLASSLLFPIALTSGAIYNIYRSATYNKPHPQTAHKTTNSGYSGFNLSVLPNRHGNLMPAVTYNKTF